MKIYVVVGEHPTQPPTLIFPHATHTGAVKRAVSLVNLMLETEDATPENWEERLEYLKNIWGARYCDVYIMEEELGE